MKRTLFTHDADFDRFWQAYPKHVAKADAQKAWRQLQPTSELVDAMIAALDWQGRLPNWTKDDGQFVPYPGSWLRARRWEDERPEQFSPVSAGGILIECPHTPKCQSRWRCGMLQRAQLV